MSERDNSEVHVNVTALTQSDEEQIDDEGTNSSADFSVPGVSEFTPLPSTNETPASWNKGLTKEDCAYMQ
ncbi:Lin-52, partial [Operophtera brumata]